VGTERASGLAASRTRFAAVVAGCWWLALFVLLAFLLLSGLPTIVTLLVFAAWPVIALGMGLILTVRATSQTHLSVSIVLAGLSAIAGIIWLAIAPDVWQGYMGVVLLSIGAGASSWVARYRN